MLKHLLPRDAVYAGFAQSYSRHHWRERDIIAFSHTLVQSLILSRKPSVCCYTPLAEKIDALCLPYATRAIKHAHRPWCNVKGWRCFLAGRDLRSLHTLSEAPTFEDVYIVVVAVAKTPRDMEQRGIDTHTGAISARRASRSFSALSQPSRPSCMPIVAIIQASKLCENVHNKR
jgi:hypothetical protein